MQWAELELISCREAMEAVSNLLHEIGAGGVVIQDPKVEPPKDDDIIWAYSDGTEMQTINGLEDKVYVIAYLPWDDQLATRLKQVRSRLEQMLEWGLGVSSDDLTVTKVDEQDWSEAWKEYYEPVKIDSLTVRPTWSFRDVDEQTTVWLDPGMAFGSGTHPTTVMCLSHLNDLVSGGEKVIDLGCGSGILAIAAAKLGAAQVNGYDIDSVACRVARENVNLNQVEDVINIEQADARYINDGGADIILGNIVADIIVGLIPQISNMLKPGGVFIGSGISLQKKEKVIASFEKYGIKQISEEKSGEWVSLVMRN